MVIACFINMLTGVIAPCGAESHISSWLLLPAVPGFFVSTLLGLDDGISILLSFLLGSVGYGILIGLIILGIKKLQTRSGIEVKNE